MTATPRRAAALGLSMLALAVVPMAARAAGAAVAIAQAPLKGAASLKVAVAGVSDGGPLPLSDTADGRNTSPALSWTDGPPGVKSYVVLLQDPDAPPVEPAVHWLVWNIPAGVTALPKAMRNIDSPTTPLGSAQGLNFHGSVGYSGPRPPQGDPPHHYHFQVFALDRTLRVRPGSPAPVVLAAMAGHVRASGELVATFQAPVAKTPKPAAAPAG